MAVDLRPASAPARMLEPIERQGWLDRLGDGVISVLEPLLADPRGAAIKDILHGRWLGHALHPVLSDPPISLWTASVVADAAGEDAAAGVLTVAGSAAALATAASGVADWTATDGRERRLALAHGLVNAGGLGLQLASLGVRAGGRSRAARALSGAGWAVSAVAAYLGGELVFDRGLMVNHDAWTAGPQAWTAVLDDRDLPEGAHRKVEVEGRAVLLSRAGGASARSRTPAPTPAARSTRASSDKGWSRVPGTARSSASAMAPSAAGTRHSRS